MMVQVVPGSTMHLGLGAWHFVSAVPSDDVVAFQQHVIATLIPNALSTVRCLALKTGHAFG